MSNKSNQPPPQRTQTENHDLEPSSNIDHVPHGLVAEAVRRYNNLANATSSIPSSSTIASEDFDKKEDKDERHLNTLCFLPFSLRGSDLNLLGLKKKLYFAVSLNTELHLNLFELLFGATCCCSSAGTTEENQVEESMLTQH